VVQSAPLDFFLSFHRSRSALQTHLDCPQCRVKLSEMRDSINSVESGGKSASCRHAAPAAARGGVMVRVSQNQPLPAFCAVIRPAKPSVLNFTLSFPAASIQLRASSIFFIQFWRCKIRWCKLSFFKLRQLLIAYASPRGSWRMAARCALSH
jgi:hypothetical protein